MSADKEKNDQLVEKIDELITVLKGVSEDLKTVASSLKSMAVGQITNKPRVSPPVPPVVRQTPPESIQTPRQVEPLNVAKPQSLEDIRMMFPEDLDNMLSFEDKGEYVMIKPKQFLGSENFAKIASTVRGINGEYISAGRDSHFRVFKKRA